MTWTLTAAPVTSQNNNNTCEGMSETVPEQVSKQMTSRSERMTNEPHIESTKLNRNTAMRANYITTAILLRFNRVMYNI